MEVVSGGEKALDSGLSPLFSGLLSSDGLPLQLKNEEEAYIRRSCRYARWNF